MRVIFTSPATPEVMRDPRGAMRRGNDRLLRRGVGGATEQRRPRLMNTTQRLPSAARAAEESTEEAPQQRRAWHVARWRRERHARRQLDAEQRLVHRRVELK